MIHVNTSNRSKLRIQRNLDFSCSTLQDLSEGYCENKRTYTKKEECNSIILFHDCNITKSNFFEKSSGLNSFRSTCLYNPLNEIEDNKCVNNKTFGISNDYCICKLTESERTDGSMSCLCFPNGITEKRKQEGYLDKCPYDEVVRRLCTSSNSTIGKLHKSHMNTNYICFTYNEDLDFEKNLLNCSTYIPIKIEKTTNQDMTINPTNLSIIANNSINESMIPSNFNVIGISNKLIQNKEYLIFVHTYTVLISIFLGFIFFMYTAYYISRKIRNRQNNGCV